MTNSGLAFHCHHGGELVEWVYDYQERVDVIKEQKPPKERRLRLRLLKLIPPDRLPPAIRKAREAYSKAWEACDEALRDYNEAREACDEAWGDYKKAREARDEAWGDYKKAFDAYDWEPLHKELCLDCSWDGQTIFTRKNESGEWY